MAKVLIFGAYANGNIGDAYQAASVARHVEACRPDLRVFAASLSRAAAPYAFPADRLFDGGGRITNPAAINGFSALIIGGGGLFASVHRPLNNPEWAARLTLPIIVLATGASLDVSERCRAILDKAAFVSGRDQFSVDVLRTIRGDAELLHDPILADPAIGPISVPSRQGMCVIPRKMTDKNRPNYEALAGIMAAGDTMLSMFPATDRASGALAMFGGRPSVETTDLAVMLDVIARCDFVVSERFHGCILALKLGIPCLGLTTSETPASKIVSLYGQLGIPELALDLRRRPLDRAGIAALLAGVDMTAIRRRIDAMTPALRDGLTRALAPVG